MEVVIRDVRGVIANRDADTIHQRSIGQRSAAILETVIGDVDVVITRAIAHLNQTIGAVYVELLDGDVGVIAIKGESIKILPA